MQKSLVMLAFFGAIGACAAPQAARVETAPSTATAQSSVKKCELVKNEEIGSRVTVREVCRNVPQVKVNPSAN